MINEGMFFYCSCGYVGDLKTCPACGEMCKYEPLRSQAEVIDIDSKVPHVVVAMPDGNAHVIPSQTLIDIACGKMEFEALDDWRIIMRTILADFIRLERKVDE